MSDGHGNVDPAIFEATVNAAWETWKAGSPQGNFFDMLATIDAALRVAKPLIEANARDAVLEGVAQSADKESLAYVVNPLISPSVGHWIRSLKEAK